jgi:hypothetical protein
MIDLPPKLILKIAVSVPDSAMPQWKPPCHDLLKAAASDQAVIGFRLAFGRCGAIVAAVPACVAHVPQLLPIDVMRPFFERGFQRLPAAERRLAVRYLWPRDVGAPQRLRDFAVLPRRVARLNIVLSRSDADAL